MAALHEKISVAVISGPVGKTPEDITYSFVFDEAHRLAKRGLAVHVIRSLQEEASFSHGIHFHGLENVSRIKYLPFLFKHLNAIPNLGYLIPPWELLYLSKYADAVANVAKSQNLDLIHAHFAYPEGFVGLLTKEETRKPLVVTVHGYDVLVEPSVGYGVRLSRRIDAIVRRVLNDADVVIAASRATFKEVCKVVNETDKVHLIPNGVDAERFNPNLNCSYIKRKLGIEGHTVIFTLRAHEPKYGLEYLIRAAPMVTKEREDAVLVIGGDGSLRCYHEQLATKLGVKEKIIFAGRIPQHEVPYYYAMSDIVVIPSLQEAFGLVVSEAMACGKPVIGTNVGGIPDQIIDGYNGFLLQPRNAAEIANKILWLISNPNEARRMGINGRKFVEKKFDMKDRVNRILALYQQILTP
jgi:N-acetyl-alpha-D-glucosaminyl L-malate synthase BshA